MTGSARLHLAGRLLAAGWGACVVGGLAVGALGPASWHDAIVDGGPGCPLRAATGIACPCCGMTRATLALGAGDLGAALALNPLAPLILLAVLGSMYLAAAGHLGRHPCTSRS